MNEKKIDDVKIGQRFILAGNVYMIENVDFDSEYNLFNITTRTGVAAGRTTVTLKVESGTPFLTLD